MNYADASTVALDKPVYFGFSRAACDLLIVWILRVGCFMCYLGHGSFGVITKEGWLPFFYLFNIPRDQAFALMPLIGTMDIALAFISLIAPRKGLLAYMVFWSLFTALLRPAAGMGWWEFLERAGNYGVPLALLLIGNPAEKAADWFKPFSVRRLTDYDLKRLAFVLRITTALLLIGHGGYEFFQVKPGLIKQFNSVGLIPVDMDKALFLQSIGLFEFALGLVTLVCPVPSFLLFVCAWKIGTELLYPLSGDHFMEFIERGGSYTAPLVLSIVISILAAKHKAEPS